MTKELRLSLTPYEHDAREYVERMYKTLAALEPLYRGTEAVEWLLTPQRCLQGEVPAQLLQWLGGTEKVAAAIAAVLDGAFA